ncbi:MAG: hypothetical protein JNK58_12385 [Phycisphaerae bacterium]|nr:hypothetical protein [Phycisphaerae bacterium]
MKDPCMSEEVKLHVLSRRQVAEGACYADWDESVCAARPTPEKSAALMSNPLLHAEDEAMQVIGTRGNRVIGRIDFVAGELVVDGRPAPILWGSAFYVPEAERRSMMGAMLLMKASGAFHTLGANGPSQMALPLYEKLKWSKVPLQRWIGVRRSRSIVRRFIGEGLAGRAARVAADIALSGVWAANSARLAVSGSGLRVRRMSEMPMEFDALLRAMAARPGVRGHRSAEWMNWLLKSQFEAQRLHERALFLVESKGGSAAGYFLLKTKFYPVATHRAFPDLVLASLADWGGFEGDRFETSTAVMLAMREAWRMGADALEVCIPPGTNSATMRSLGFMPAGVMSYMWRATRPSVLADDRYKAPEAWSMTYADGENVPG